MVTFSHPHSSLKETFRTMKKFLFNAFATGALLSIGIASQAQQFTYNMVPGTTTFSTFPGVVPTGDVTLTNFFSTPVVNPQTYSVPSVLSFGIDNTAPGTGGASTTGTFTAVPISYDFQVDSGTSIGATVNNFTASGFINGDVGYDATSTPFSRAQITYTSLVDNTTGQSAFVTADPQNTLPALLLFTVINNSSVAIFLDQNQSVPIPGGTFVNQGYIAATALGVPEPGSVAMLVGMGISGSAFLLRKRRRA